MSTKKLSNQVGSLYHSNRFTSNHPPVNKKYIQVTTLLNKKERENLLNKYVELKKEFNKKANSSPKTVVQKNKVKEEMAIILKNISNIKLLLSKTKTILHRKY